MIEKVTYAGHEDNYRLSDGTIEAIIATGFGPRVVRLGFVGGPNEFAELPEFTAATPYGTWRMYGGHRLWHSPEANPRTYYPDNDPLHVEAGDDSIKVRQAVEPPTGIRKSLRLRLGEGYFDVDHVLTNEGVWPVELAPWAISVMAPGGVALLQQAQARDPANLLPNRALTIWPYTDLRDKRLHLGLDLIRLHQDVRAAGPIKIGINNDSGWVAYYNHDHLFVKRFFIDPLSVYPDNGCTVECYTNADMLEVESLGPLVLLEPGESTYHSERWYLFEQGALPLDDENALLEALSLCLDCTSEPD